MGDGEKGISPRMLALLKQQIEELKKQKGERCKPCAAQIKKIRDSLKRKIKAFPFIKEVHEAGCLAAWDCLMFELFEMIEEVKKEYAGGKTKGSPRR